MALVVVSIRCGGYDERVRRHKAGNANGAFSQAKRKKGQIQTRRACEVNVTPDVRT